MAAKPIRMDQIRTLLQQHLRGISIRTIARNTGLSRNTVRGYLRSVEQSGYTIEQALALNDQQFSTLILASDTPPSGGQRQQNLLKWIEQHGKDLHNKHVTRQLLWEEYRQVHPDGYGYTWFCHHLNDFLGHRQVTALFSHRPGEKIMIDFAGDSLYYIDPDTGQKIPTQVWVSVLPFSSYMYVEALPSQKQEEVAGCLQRTLAFLGGVPQSALFDNLRSVVKRADRYQPTFTELMETLSVHYQCTFMATRAGKPRDKPHVETAVRVAYKRIYGKLRGQTFYSLDELNDAIWKALEELNSRPFKGKTFSRRDLFEQYEKPLLSPLPAEAFVVQRRAQVKVQKNYHVILGQDMHQYSVPYRFAGKQVRICWTTTQVQIYYNHQRIALHQRNPARYGYTTCPQHMPSHHQAIHQQHGWDGVYFLGKAAAIGPATRHSIEVILSGKVFPEQTYKSCLGTLRLADKYTPERLEAVCRLLEHSPKITYMLIKAMLENNRDQHLLHQQAPDVLTPQHANLRGPQTYQ